MKIRFLPILLLIPILSYAQTGQKNFIDQNYIEVIGKAEMEIVPDIIDMKIVINEKDTKGKTSLNDLESAMFSRLKEMEFDLEKDLAVKDLTSSLKYHVLFKTDIELSKEYILTVKDANSAARVITGLEEIGVSNIEVARLDHTEIEKFRKDVKISAIKAAKTKAGYLAEAVDQDIGRALYFEEVQNVPANYAANSNIMIRGYGGYASSSSKLPDIEFEKIRLTSAIKVRFALQ